MKTVNDVMEEYYEEMVEKTYRNIVLHIRRDALLRILGGENPVDVIPESHQRRKLNRDNVLETFYGQGGKQIRVTHRAKSLLLRDIYGEEKDEY